MAVGSLLPLDGRDDVQNETIFWSIRKEGGVFFDGQLDQRKVEPALVIDRYLLMDGITLDGHSEARRRTAIVGKYTVTQHDLARASIQTLLREFVRHLVRHICRFP